MKQSTKIILAVIGVSIVALTFTGVAVAFFFANITGGTESLSANTVVLGSLSGTGNPITLENAEPGSEGTAKNYSVTYASGATVAKSYSLSLVITNNEFVNTVKDLQNSSTTQGGQLVIEVTIPSTVTDFTVDTTNSNFISYNSTTRVITIDATNSIVAKSGTYSLLTGVYIGPGETQNFTTKVKFINLESYNQNDNQGKSFNGFLTISNPEDADIIYYGYGDPIQYSTDYTNLSFNSAFLKKQGDEYSHCISINGEYECFKENNFEEEFEHATALFHYQILVDENQYHWFGENYSHDAGGWHGTIIRLGEDGYVSVQISGFDKCITGVNHNSFICNVSEVVIDIEPEI